MPAQNPFEDPQRTDQRHSIYIAMHLIDLNTHLRYTDSPVAIMARIIDAAILRVRCHSSVADTRALSCAHAQSREYVLLDDKHFVCLVPL